MFGGFGNASRIRAYVFCAKSISNAGTQPSEGKGKEAERLQKKAGKKEREGVSKKLLSFFFTARHSPCILSPSKC